MFLTYIRIYNISAIFICITALINASLYWYTAQEKYILFICLCQTFFLIEIINIKTKVSKSMIAPTLLQLTSRLFISWFVCYMHSIPKTLFTIMCFAWFISDVVRYLFYLTKLKAASMLRYNMFLILYPTGALIEVILMGVILKHYSGIFRLLLIGIAISYIPGFIFLFGHMLKQRMTVSKRNEKMKKKI